MDKRCDMPILAITLGDVCGVGPEIVVKALQNKTVYEICKPLVIGDVRMVERALEAAGLSGVAVTEVMDIRAHDFSPDKISVKNVPIDIDGPVPYAKVTSVGGHAAYTAIAEAIRLAMDNQVDGTVTAPLNKEALNLAGYHYSGHTEIYADLTNTHSYTMMLADGPLRVVHVSTHVSLREACNRVKKDRVLEVIRLAHQACLELGISKPRVAVAGLNPHCGENGLFGTEEIEEISPAIEAARAEGIDATGPVPPDTVFSKARGRMFDIVVAMYHDQGHIPLKVVGFVYDESEHRWRSVTGVNITLGLPIIRTSVDHGTAFELAGTGQASELSMLNAISIGAEMARIRLKKKTQ